MQGMSLDCLDPIARGACAPVPYETVIVRFLGRRAHLEHYTNSGLKHNLSLHKKETHLIVWSFILIDRLQVCPTSQGYRGTLSEHRKGDTISAPSLDLTTPQGYLPERSTCHPGNTSGPSGQWSAEFTSDIKLVP